MRRNWGGDKPMRYPFGTITGGLRTRGAAKAIGVVAAAGLLGLAAALEAIGAVVIRAVVRVEP